MVIHKIWCYFQTTYNIIIILLKCNVCISTDSLHFHCLYLYDIFLFIYQERIQISQKYIFTVLFSSHAKQRLSSKQRNKSCNNRWNVLSICIFTIISQDSLKNSSSWHCSILLERLWQSVFKGQKQSVEVQPPPVASCVFYLLNTKLFPRGPY